MAPLKSIAVLAALLLSVVAFPCEAAPGAFELSATAACFSYSPVIYLSWSASSGVTRYQVLRDGQPITLKKDFGAFYDDDVVTGGPAHSYVVRATDAGPVATDSNTVTIAATAQCAPAPPAAFTISGKPFCAPGDAVHTAKPGVYLSWDKVRYASHFDIYRDGLFVFRLQAFSDEILYEYEAAPVSGGPFTYSVTAENPLGKSTSNAVVLTIPDDICITAPALPGSFTATISTFCISGNPAVHIAWTRSSDAASYTVIRDGSPISGTLPASTESYDDGSVIAGQTHWYRVIATNVAGSVGPFAGTVTPSASICPPGAFSLAAEASCNPVASPQVTLNWTTAATATSYVIARNGVEIAIIEGSGRTFTDNTTTRGQTYRYAVRAVGPGGTADSNGVTLAIAPAMCPAVSIPRRRAATH